MPISESSVDARPGEAMLLVEEICHRVLNEYTEVVATLALAASETADEKARQVLNHTAGMLRDYARAHHALRAPRAASADLADYLEALCAALASARLHRRDIRLLLSTESVPLAADRCWRVGLVVAELVSNSLRHGFDVRGGEIEVQLRRAPGCVLCRVRDNGVGFEAHLPGSGSRIVEHLAAELGGVIRWSGGRGGVSVDLIFPSAGS